MDRHFTLEYWIDEGWYVGRLKEVPGAFSQGETLEELEENIKEAYSLMMAEEEVLPPYERHQKELEIQV
jgi:predicted RNase H-like HicB family nuclease